MQLTHNHIYFLIQVWKSVTACSFLWGRYKTGQWLEKLALLRRKGKLSVGKQHQLQTNMGGLCVHHDFLEHVQAALKLPSDVPYLNRFALSCVVF